MTSLHEALAIAASFLLLAAMFTPLERAFPARSGQRILRPHVLVDGCFFLGQYLVFAGIATRALDGVHAGVARLVPLGVATFAARAPVLAVGLASIVLGDVAMYWFHRASHRFDFLWRFHAVHHTSEHLDWVAAHREHPVDGVLTQIVMNLPAMILGLPYEAVGALIVLRGVWAVFIHSNVALDVGPLRWILGAPELHHWHHAKVRSTEHNFANLAPWLDRLFGTYHRPTGRETWALGIDESHPRDWARLLVWPLLPKPRDASLSPALDRSSPA
ncbi:MAG TPA: sterol desaturase family protein [Polyangiaceae bacterium]|nr:sterol desaturase family protein [Polyangiaceae bacterium]